MPTDPQVDRVRRQRMRHAERKLREVQQRLVRTERRLVYWPRIVADLKYETTQAVQHPLWSEEEVTEGNEA